MRTYRKWVMTLGIIAVTPSMTMAGPLSFLKSKPAAASNSSASQPGRRTNQQVAEEIARQLKEAGLDRYDIGIEFKGGIALVSGKVATVEQRELATKLIRRIPEVKKVDNRLTSIAAKQSDTRQVGFETEATNSRYQIQQASATQELPQVTAAPQSAPAAAPAAFAPAQTAAAPVQPAAAAPAQIPAAPVTPAFAETAPARPATNNQQVAQQIGEALSPVLKGFDVEVRYKDGVAILSGVVATPEQRAAAGQITSRVPGVQSVSNQLRYPGADQSAAQQEFANRQLAMANYQPNGAAPDVAPAPPGSGPAPQYGYAGPMGAQPVLNNPNLPPYAWPSYASYPNYAQVTYPTQYSASAWPYIGPFYPYPQVPLGWRQVQLEWDDGMWNLNFRPRTDRWWWFLHPKNW